MSKSTDWQEELKERFGAFAILGKAGRFYNGVFDNNTRLSEVEDFIQSLIDASEKEIKRLWAENMSNHIIAVSKVHKAELDTSYKRGYEKGKNENKPNN